MGEATKQPLLEALNCHPESGSRRIEGPRNVTVMLSHRDPSTPLCSAQDDERSDDRLIIADVRIFCFVAELRRELGVAGVDPRNIAWQQWIIALPISRDWPKQDFEQARDVSRCRTANPAHDAIAGRSGIAFIGVNCRNRHRDFRRGEEEIREAATELARRSVIV